MAIKGHNINNNIYIIKTKEVYLRNIIIKKIGDITPYENNPRKNDQAVEAVANSIKEFGWQQPLVLDKDNNIIIGHTRFKAAKSLGMDEVPCIIADNLSDEQIKALRLADNKVGELAEWDEVLLNIELDELSDFDMSDFGFDFDVYDEENNDAENEKSEVDLKENFELIIDCESEFDMQEKYNMLKEMGIECRISTL